MFKKVIKNKLSVILSITLCALAIFAAPASTLTTFAADGSDVSVCADIIRWLYKVEGGKMYKALYNCSTGEYLTEWEYVCDYPPEE